MSSGSPSTAFLSTTGIRCAYPAFSSAVCDLICSLLYLFGKRSALLAAVALATLVIYWAILKFAPVPGIGAGQLDSYGNFPAYVDRAVFGIHHLWAYGLTPGRGVTYDSEGILSTIPALFSTLAGILAGDWLRTSRPGRSKALGLVLPGIALILIGLALSPLMPLNKRILTPTFALFSTGVALTVFAFIYVLVDLYRLRRGLTPLLVLGTNAILAFVLSSMLTSLLALQFKAGGITTSSHGWANDHLFAPWLPPNLASLAYACAIVAFNMLLIYPLYRKHVFLKL